MTNKEDGDATPNSTPRVAAFLAVHLVTQILEEAYLVANAAKDSGQPWQYMSMLKSFKAGRLNKEDEEAPCEASQGDCGMNDNNMGMVANVGATSTPQKLTRLDCSDETEHSILHNDATIIGQGDEDLEMHQHELKNSTNMFINHLFDMSDVERNMCDGDDTAYTSSVSEIVQSASECHYLSEIMNQVTFDEANTVMSGASPLEPNVRIIDGPAPGDLSRTSARSLLADAFVADITRDVTFYIEDNCNKHQNVERYATTVEEGKHGDSYRTEPIHENDENKSKENDVALYEKAYVTLNRDYEQGSEEDGFPVLQDPKGMNLQEVQLMTANTSEDDLSYPGLQEKQKVQETVPTVSGISFSQKSSLARRFRVQGARLLACIRGWWRRKTPAKRKKPRGLITLGICPLSPDARRRASSLMDNRLLRSPSPSRPIVWKFNTVNEAMVNSNCWKDYTFDIRPDDY